MLTRSNWYTSLAILHDILPCYHHQGKTVHERLKLIEENAGTYLHGEEPSEVHCHMELLVKSKYAQFTNLESAWTHSWSPHLQQVVTLHLWKILFPTSCLGNRTSAQSWLYHSYIPTRQQHNWHESINSEQTPGHLDSCTAPLCISSCHKLLRAVIYFILSNKAQGFASYRQDSIGLTLTKCMKSMLYSTSMVK